VLVVPKKHVTAVRELGDGDAELIGRVMLAARTVAAKLGLASGYRLVVNDGDDAGQSVHHIHVHVLGGRPMTWPPG
jgi:histidine triad (HIT) family protein